MASTTETFLKSRVSKPTLNKWSSGFTAVKEYAEKNNLPLIGVWSNGDACGHCVNFEKSLMTTEFLNWQKTSGCIFWFGCSSDKTTDDKTQGTGSKWAKNSKLTTYPFVRVYWKKGKVDSNASGSTWSGGTAKGGQKLVDKFKSGWKAEGIKVDLMAKIICIITNTSIQLSSAELISIVNDTIYSENVLNNQRIRLSIDSKLIAKYRRIQLIEESMRRAVKTKEGLFVCFQPIINTEDPGMITAEVLLRYNDKNLGIIQPSEFIPIVERRGLALFIDSYVVEAGCRFLAANPEVDMLHINLSATEFFHNPVQRITAIVNDHGVDPHRICFEITESSAAKNPEILLAFMKSMISRGFSFALDDYGTGYSNALQVMSMPFKFVKIPSVISSKQERSRRFIDGTIRLFMDLGISTVVEGVETKEQLDEVKSLGVNYIQGFYYSVPLEENDYIAYIKGGRTIG